jgi:PPOX class probable F420-dependent enzyme
MSPDQTELISRFASSPVARLATVQPDGAPHLVPVVFALVGDVVYTAVDGKPKRTRQLQRLANLRHEPRCALLVDHYDDDWERLWWVRADGEAVIVEQPAPSHPGLVALINRYRQYQAQPPPGPLVAVTVTRWSGWSPRPSP